jgi:hypothetical protein
MADKKFTLLELHFEGDVVFSPTNNAPALGSGPGEESETEDASDEVLTDDEGGSRGLVLLGVFVLVVLLAAIARALRGDDADLGDLSDLDDLAEE